MALSKSTSLFVLLAIICVATAHPIRSSSKASVKKASELNTAIKANSGALVENEDRKRKIKKVVRKQRSHRDTHNVDVGVINSALSVKEKINTVERNGSDGSDSDSSSDSSSDDSSSSDSDSSSDDDSSTSGSESG